MNWDQAKFRLALAEELHKLRIWKADPNDWITPDKELQESWKGIIDFEGQ